MDDAHRKARLQHLIAIDYDGEQKRFSERSGLGKSRVSQLLSPKHPFGPHAARALEEGVGLPKFWFENVWPTPKEVRAGNNPDSHQVHEPVRTIDYLPTAKDEQIIKQYDVRGSMGVGVLLRDQPGVINSWSVTPEWIQKNVHSVTSPKNLAIVTGFGDSMKPMYNPGDPLLVDTGVKSVDFDGVYFFRIGDEGYIKRLQRIPGVGLRAISENKAYEPWDVPKEDFEVFARVVKVWRGDDY